MSVGRGTSYVLFAFHREIGGPNSLNISVLLLRIFLQFHNLGFLYGIITTESKKFDIFDSYILITM